MDGYELVAPIGEGGMAEVWVARREGKHGFEKFFAIKCIHRRFAEEPTFRTMFLNEARIAAAIEHPNVAQIYDLGESQGMLYLVLEYVDGESIAALMTAASRRANEAILVPPPVAFRIIAEACAGLHAAHELKDTDGRSRGIVHRDVSPQNVLVSVKGIVKVIDFGIAHATDSLAGSTGEGALKGKLHYVAPEQVLRETLSGCTDVFGLGATLYRMLAGRPPFDGGSDAATLHRLVSGHTPPPLPDHVPPSFAALVLRALARDPRDRYPTARAMQEELEQALEAGGFMPDVAAWATNNASEPARALRTKLASRSSQPFAPGSSSGGPTFDAELAPMSVRAPLATPQPPVVSSPPPPKAAATPAVVAPLDPTPLVPSGRSGRPHTGAERHGRSRPRRSCKRRTSANRIPP